MKSTFLLFALLGSSLPLLAVPRPDQFPEEIPAPPAGVAEPEAQAPELGDPKKKGVGFLGVSAQGVPFGQAQQLKIEQGVSLLTVMAGTPAARAGLKVGDIITQVGEVKIGDMFALRDAIRAHKEGDRVALKVVQNGKPGLVKVTLAAAPFQAAGAMQGGFGMRVMPGAQFGGGLRLNFGGGGAGALRLGDGEGSVELKGRGERREVTVRDHNDEIVFEGPWVTPQDKASAPPHIKQRIERIAGMFGDDAFGRLDFAIPAPAPLMPDNEKILPPKMKLEFNLEVPKPALPKPDGLKDLPPPPGQDE